MAFDSAAVATTTNQASWAKIRYAKIWEESYPENYVLQKEFPFANAEKVGDHYEQPVEATMEGGITVSDANGTVAIDLSEPVQQEIQAAKVYDAEFTQRTYILNSFLMKAANGEVSYGNMVDHKVMAMRNGLSSMIEQIIIDGKNGLAKTTTAAATPSGYVTVTFSVRTWSTTKFVGKEGWRFQFYNSSTLVAATGGTGIFTLYSITPGSRQLVVTGSVADMAALVTAATATAASLDLYFAGCYNTEFAGLIKAASNTGTLWNIDGSRWSVWKGQTESLASGEKLTREVLFRAAQKAAARAGNVEMLCVAPFCGVASLLNDLSTLQNSQGGKNAVEVGADMIRFLGPTGWFTVIPHAQMSDGYAVILPRKKGKRIGAADITFGLNGKAEVMIPVFGKNCQELQCFTTQAFYIPCPGKMVLIESSATTATL